MTQAELDKAVLDAADNYEKGQSHLRMEVHIEPLLEAVRARRAAMRPHKAAVLLAFMWGNLDGEGFYWNNANESTRSEARRKLQLLLAAPDEEQP